MFDFVGFLTSTEFLVQIASLITTLLTLFATELFAGLFGGA